MTAGKAEPPFEVRVSPIHGSGVFAIRHIRAGQPLIDYLGLRLTGSALKKRLEDKTAIDNPHTFLFRINPRIYVDAAVDGNDARFINHSCQPNCETRVRGYRITIRSVQTIRPGEELTYDYALEIEEKPSPARRKLFLCRCGAEQCRGTMLDESGHGKPVRRARSSAAENGKKTKSSRPPKRPQRAR